MPRTTPKSMPPGRNVYAFFSLSRFSPRRRRNLSRLVSKRIRVLFLVPILAAKETQPVLEREGLPYSLKPYHLNEFLEKVGDLLVEAGALAGPIPSMDFTIRRRRHGSRSARDKRTGAMFASREDYQMSEEEMIEFEHQEEEDRKKREKQQKDREHL